MQPSKEQAELSAPQIRSELQRIASSDLCRRSPQLQRLLLFLVEESLGGHGDRLKEYVIGVEVFSRPPSYDPRLDSLVRVEARRLRALLAEYYAGEGEHNPVRISLPTGSYRPVFHPVAEAAPPSLKKSSRFAAWTFLGIAAILLVAFIGYRMAARPRPMQVRTIAVLPFDNLTGDGSMDLFCFGLMDEVTTELAKSGQLRVVARTSSQIFKRGDDVATIARKLQADAVLEGSVSKSGDEIRIIAQLIDARDQVHIWSESYVRPPENTIRVQDEVAFAIASALRERLAPGVKHARTRYSEDAAANQFYWKGMSLRTPMGKTGWRDNLARSAEYLEAAVQADNRFAAAYAGLADVYVSLAWERGGGPVTQDLMTRGRRAAERALALDDTLAEAYGALGRIQFFFDYDPAAAEKSFVRALSLDSSSGGVRMWYAYALAMQRRPDEAITQAKQARELDPLSFIATTHLAVVYYFSRHNDDALKLVDETMGFSNIAPVHGLRGMILETQGKYDQAIREYKTGLQMAPKHPYIKGMLGHAYAMSGHPDEATLLLNDADKPFEQGGLSDLKQAYILLALGQTDEALRHLEQDFNLHDPELPYANADPVFDPVRNHPRFQTLMAKMHLAKQI
ncbi:MAG TPA: tetratricopeptide repeat protein [Terriglobales bacterium]|nr:tetratricopeptide repeat protein [Terriglobales bacterium]